MSTRLPSLTRSHDELREEAKYSVTRGGPAASIHPGAVHIPVAYKGRTGQNLRTDKPPAAMTTHCPECHRLCWESRGSLREAG